MKGSASNGSDGSGGGRSDSACDGSDGAMSGTTRALGSTALNSSTALSVMQKLNTKYSVVWLQIVI